MALKLEVGKIYTDRHGNKRGPMMRNAGAPWHKFTDGHLSWGEYGGAMSDGREFPHDLIAECTEAPTGPVRTVTRRKVVPGRYGQVSIRESYDDGFQVDFRRALTTAAELRAAIATLTEIADALEDI